MGKKKTNEEFLREVYDLVGNEYIFLEEYKNTKNKLLCKHITCGHLYATAPHNFLRNKRCPRCAGTWKRNTNDMIEDIFNLVGKEYTVIGQYINSLTPIKMRHNLCGKTFYPTRGNFLQGHRCPSCMGGVGKTHEWFTETIYALVGDEYSFHGEYSNSSTKMKFKHSKCDTTWEITPNNFIKGKRCPSCNESKGERIISGILNKYKIEYTGQYKFENCRYNYPLPFDFYLKKINICIEYDGEQHFEVIKAWGGKDKFERTQINDQIKNDYCFNNNIPLLRIPYWESDNIENIIFDFLVEHGVLEEIKELENV